MSNLKLYYKVILISLIINSYHTLSWNNGDDGTWAMGCDFDGNDLTNVGSKGEECSGKCKSTSGCTHFTWTDYNGGTCWMKKGSISHSNAKDSAEGNVCGILKSDGIKWNNGPDGLWAMGCDFNGNDLTNVRSSGEECSGKCKSTNGCTHFTWTDYNDGTCWMKHGSISQEQVVQAGDNVVCGIVSKIPSSKLNCIAYEPFSDPNYPGNVNAALRNTLKSVQAQGFKCIKTYYSQYYGLKIADYASQFGLKIVLGIRMEESFRENEIQVAIDSCKSFNNIIAIYAGNENLPNLAQSSDIINIKNRVKGAGCNVPFGTVQTIGYFLFQADRNLVNQMDWLGYNVYPFFSRLGGGSSGDSLRAQIGQLKNAYKDQFSKFLISETGWPSSGGRSEQDNEANIDNARKYADQFASMLCSGEINTNWVSYFTFFDPSYKQNVPEFEKHFGVSDRYGNPKWNVGNLHC